MAQRSRREARRSRRKSRRSRLRGGSGGGKARRTRLRSGGGRDGRHFTKISETFLSKICVKISAHSDR